MAHTTLNLVCYVEDWLAPVRDGCTVGLTVEGRGHRCRSIWNMGFDYVAVYLNFTTGKDIIVKYSSVVLSCASCG